MEEPEGMRRKSRFVSIDADFDSVALVMTYEVEAVALDQYGQALQVEKRLNKKKIRLKTLNENSNVPLLCEDIIRGSRLLHSSIMPTLNKLVYKLQQHVVEQSAKADSVSEMKRAVARKRKAERRSREEEERRKAEEAHIAELSKVDDYMALLYEDSMEAKERGTAMIRELARMPGNLDELIQNDALLGALARVLKEEHKKSSRLVMNILCVFFSFSNFRQMHRFLLNHRVGDQTMRIISLELKRHKMRVEDLAEMERAEGGADADGDGDDDLPASASTADGTAVGKAEGKAEGDGDGHGGSSEGKEDAASSSTAKKRSRRDKKGRRKRRGGDGEAEESREEASDSSKKSEEARRRRRAKKARRDGPVDLARERRRLKKQMAKQDELFYLAFHILLNLAEDPSIERKMVKRHIVKLLTAMLDRKTVDLQVLVVTFLKRLSIYEENKDKMAELGVISSLVPLVSGRNDFLTMTTLRLLFNLSFDAGLRDVMLNEGLIPKLVELLKRAPFRAITLQLLYHLSQDDRAKNMFTYTEATSLVQKLVLNTPYRIVGKELIALAINLSWDGRNAAIMSRGGGLRAMLTRVLKTGDSCLMKVVRNISCWTRGCQEELPEEARYEQANLWSPYIEELVNMAVRAEDTALLVEILGTLGNMTPRDLARDASWGAIMERHGVLDFLHRLFVPRYDGDDLLLEVVVFVGALALDATAAPLIAASRVIRGLYNTLQAKGDDEEIVLQTLFTMYRLMRHDVTCKTILYDTDAVLDICNLLAHDNAQVRRTADMALDLVMDFDRVNGSGSLFCHVRQRRFELHNKEWVDMIADEDDLSGEEEAKSGGDVHGDDYDHYTYMGARHEMLAVDASALDDDAWEGAEMDSREAHSGGSSDGRDSISPGKWDEDEEEWRRRGGGGGGGGYR